MDACEKNRISPNQPSHINYLLGSTPNQQYPDGGYNSSVGRRDMFGWREGYSNSENSTEYLNYSHTNPVVSQK